MTRRRRILLLGLLAIGVAAALAFFGVRTVPLLKRPPLSPSLVPQEWADVHDSPGHRAHVGKADIKCSSCHDESDGGFRSLRETACTSCHAKEVEHHHDGNSENPTTCLTCHQFTATPAPTCLGCHAGTQGKSAAVAVHVSSGAPCISCHAPHGEQKALQADCATCHKETTAQHGSMKVSTDVAGHPPHATDAIHAASGTCADCHAPHAHAVVAQGTCRGCHEDKPQGDKPSGHPACVTCHEPHQATRAAVKACVTCHAEKRPALTAAHTECATCHKPHETQQARASCSTCHANKPTLGAPGIAAHAACDNCHKPHEPKASMGNACVSCHSAITVDHAPGGASTCTSCHDLHPKKASATTAMAIAKPCTTCHKEATSDVTGHTKGLGCTSCHKPHEFRLGKPKAALCTSCHASETKVAMQSLGHKDCIQCHSDVHKPEREKPCASCHSQEASSAPPGHQACQGCHAPHDGHLTKGAACATCHAQEASTKHSHVPGGCATCHQPHGPAAPKGPKGPSSPPTCLTCHTNPKLPGLHKLIGKNPAGHQQCGTCHSAHQPVRDDRATCTSCHEDRKNHQKAATKCNGCHIFRAP
ncbi:MAG: Cytochrome c family protein [Labilithrix sp.]|nr:Cytochrome c family protein [Labilithrix sp.]